MKSSICDRLWQASRATLVPQIIAWGFKPIDSVDAKLEQARREQTLALDKNDFSIILQLWVDCRSISLILDGALLSEEELEYSVQSPHDIRLRSKFRLVRSYWYFFVQGDISYRLKGGSPDAQDIDKLIEEFSKDLPYMYLFLFSNYRGRRVIIKR